jgi:thiol:disulfide interchange protein DsbC
MLKLSAIAVAGTTLIAATNTEVETFLKQQIGANPAVKSLDVKVVDKKVLDAPKGWDALIINLKAEVKQGSTTRPITQSMIYFTSGDYITADLTNIKTGAQLKNEIAPSFKKEFYKEANLIYGNKNAKHKIAIFSDPLCPFCRRFVPDALKYMKEYPDSFAVYYYHLPLESLHPAAVTLTRAAIAAELKGKKDVVLDMYNVEINAKETDEQKILDAFNKQLGTKITIKDIHAPEIEKQSSFDMSVVQAMMVNGTPTVFFDGKKDGSKSKYKAVKVK